MSEPCRKCGIDKKDISSLMQRSLDYYNDHFDPYKKLNLCEYCYAWLGESGALPLIDCTISEQKEWDRRLFEGKTEWEQHLKTIQNAECKPTGNMPVSAARRRMMERNAAKATTPIVDNHVPTEDLASNINDLMEAGLKLGQQWDRSQVKDMFCNQTNCNFDETLKKMWSSHLQTQQQTPMVTLQQPEMNAKEGNSEYKDFVRKEHAKIIELALLDFYLENGDTVPNYKRELKNAFFTKGYRHEDKFYDDIFKKTRKRMIRRTKDPRTPLSYKMNPPLGELICCHIHHEFMMSIRDPSQTSQIIHQTHRWLLQRKTPEDLHVITDIVNWLSRQFNIPSQDESTTTAVATQLQSISITPAERNSALGTN